MRLPWPIHQRRIAAPPLCSAEESSKPRAQKLTSEHRETLRARNAAAEACPDKRFFYQFCPRDRNGQMCDCALGFSAQHSAAQRSTAQHSTAQRSAAQRRAAQRSAAQRSAAQHSTAHITPQPHGNIPNKCYQKRPSNKHWRFLLPTTMP